MNESDNDKVGLKFWVGALAFSVLLLATTFAILASYLAEIKVNTADALARADIVAQRLNTLDMEIADIHHHIMAEKAAMPAPMPSTEAAPSAAPGGEAPAAIAPAIAVQPPALAPPAPPVPAKP